MTNPATTEPQAAAEAAPEAAEAVEQISSTEVQETTQTEETQIQKKPMSMKEARQSARERALAMRDAMQQKQGQQAGEPTEGSAETETTEESGATETTEQVEAQPKSDESTEETKQEPTGQPEEKPTESQTSEAQAGDKPQETPTQPSYITIEVPQDHPLASGGVKEFVARNEFEARQIRALMNGYVRRGQLEEVQSRNVELQRQIARNEAEQEARQKYEQSDQYKQAMQVAENIRQQEEDGLTPKGTADAYLAGTQAERQRIVEELYQEKAHQIDAKQAEEAGQRWTQEAYTRVAAAFPPAVQQLPGYRDIFARALHTFNAELGLGTQGNYGNIQPGDTEAMHVAFVKHCRSRFVNEPAVRNILKRNLAQKQQQQQTAANEAAAKQAELDRIRQEAIEGYKKTLAEQNQTKPKPNPLAQVPGATRSRVPTELGDDGIDLSKLPPNERMKAARMRARQRGRAMERK